MTTKAKDDDSILGGLRDLYNEATGGKGLMELAKEHPDMAKGAGAATLLLALYSLPIPNMVKYPIYGVVFGWLANKYLLPLMGTDGKELISDITSMLKGDKKDSAPAPTKH